MNNAHFKVDPQLTALLGDNYRSSEVAIKELIDNAWDAEATEVKVYLPSVMTDQPMCRSSCLIPSHAGKSAQTPRAR